MAQDHSDIRNETAKWRKLLRGVLARADRPERLDRYTTRGKMSVGYDPLPTGWCLKHDVRDDDGKFLYHINDPFCRVCFPEPRQRRRGGSVE